MPSELPPHCVESIGEVAGQVWHYLKEQGSVTLSKLSRDIDAPRDLVMQGVGWLAREGKIVFEARARNKTICLKED